MTELVLSLLMAPLDGAEFADALALSTAQERADARVLNELAIELERDYLGLLGLRRAHLQADERGEEREP